MTANTSQGTIGDSECIRPSWYSLVGIGLIILYQFRDPILRRYFKRLFQYVGSELPALPFLDFSLLIEEKTTALVHLPY